MYGESDGCNLTFVCDLDANRIKSYDLRFIFLYIYFFFFGSIYQDDIAFHPKIGAINFSFIFRSQKLFRFDEKFHEYSMLAIFTQKKTNFVFFFAEIKQNFVTFLHVQNMKNYRFLHFVVCMFIEYRFILN